MGEQKVNGDGDCSKLLIQKPYSLWEKAVCKSGSYPLSCSRGSVVFGVAQIRGSVVFLMWHRSEVVWCLVRSEVVWCLVRSEVVWCLVWQRSEVVWCFSSFSWLSVNWGHAGVMLGSCSEALSPVEHEAALWVTASQSKAALSV